MKYASQYVTPGGATPSGSIKIGNIAVDAVGDAYLSGGYIPGVQDTYDTNGYIIVSDTVNAGLVGRTTGGGTGVVGASSTSTYWASNGRSDSAFMAIANRLPARIGQPLFTDGASALSWMNSNGYWTSYRFNSIYDNFSSRVMGGGLNPPTTNVLEGGSCISTGLAQIDLTNLLSTASFVYVPGGYTASVLYSQVSNTSEDDLTFSRASTATRINSSGLIESVLSNVQQLDYSSGGCQTILLEPQRRNILNNSQWAGASSGAPGTPPTNWSLAAGLNTGSISLTASSYGTGDGSQAVQFTTSGTREVLTQVINTTANVVYTFSVYIESYSGNIALSNIFGEAAGLTGTSKTYYFQDGTNLSTGFSNVSSVGRYYMTYSNTVGGAFIARFGNGADGIATGSVTLSRPQIEDNGTTGSVSYPTSFIPTTTSGSVTRASSSFSLANVYTNGLIGASGGTWLIELKNNKSLTRDSFNRLISLNTSSSGTGTDALWIYNSSGTGRLAIAKTVSGTASVLYTTTSDTARIVIKWNGSTADIFVNGTEVIAATAFTGTALDYLVAPSGTGISGYISQMALWNTPLTDDQCTALSMSLKPGTVFSEYASRVIANSGTVEGNSCAVSTLTYLYNLGLLYPTLSVVPSGYKSGTIYAELPNTSNGDLTFTRTSTATRVNSSGRIETVASGVPQLDYSLGGCPNFLFEPQRTNFVYNSEQFNTWSINNVSVTTNVDSTPFGNFTADLAVPTNTLAEHSVIGIGPGATSATETYSVYAKSSGYSFVGLRANINNVWVVSFYNLSTGSVVSTGAGMTTSIQSAGNGWYRCIVTYTNRTIIGIQIIPHPTGSGVTFTGDGTSGVLLFGAQCEVGAFATSYIPTPTSASVTRTSPSISRSNIYTNGLIGASGGTWLVEIKNNLSLIRDTPRLIYIGDTGDPFGATANAIHFNGSAGSPNRLAIAKTISGSYTAIYNTVADSLKIVIKWDGSNINIFANGSKVVTNSSFTTTVMENFSSTIGVSVYISQMALWNKPLTDDQCIALSMSLKPETVFSEYVTRVIADSGTVEGNTCAVSTLTSLYNLGLLYPTLSIVPSGYKSGTIYTELPNATIGDLSFTRTTTATRVNSSGSIENVASGVPQIDYSLGGCPVLLLEPQRTNWVRNSTFAGAVVGSPGTLPTNYGEPNTTLGLTRSVAATGSENGLSYIDLQYTGTASSTSSYRLTVDNASTNIPGATGQNWTMSAYMKIVSSTSLPADFQIGFVERNSAGTYLTSRYTTVTVNTAFQRQAASNSTVSATIAAVCPEIVFPVVNGNSYNFVLRIYAPQFEQGAFATSYIPTTTATVTRNASSFTRSNIYTNGLIGASGGTWFVELKNNLSLTRDTGDLGIMLSTSSNYFSSGSAFTIRNSSAGSSKLNLMVYTPIGSIAFQTGGISSISPKIIFRLNTSTTTVDIFVNGSKVGTYASFSATALEYLNCYGTDVPKYISQMALWNTPLSDAQCVSLTT